MLAAFVAMSLDVVEKRSIGHGVVKAPLSVSSAPEERSALNNLIKREPRDHSPEVFLDENLLASSERQLAFVDRQTQQQVPALD